VQGCRRLLDRGQHEGMHRVAWTRKLRHRRPRRPGQRRKRRRRNGCTRNRFSREGTRSGEWCRLRRRRTSARNDRHCSASLIASSVSRVLGRSFLQRWYLARDRPPVTALTGRAITCDRAGAETARWVRWLPLRCDRTGLKARDRRS
jgi:hypothetical protein